MSDAAERCPKCGDRLASRRVVRCLAQGCGWEMEVANGDAVVQMMHAAVAAERDRVLALIAADMATQEKLQHIGAVAVLRELVTRIQKESP